MPLLQEDLINVVESALTRESLIRATLNSFNHFVEYGIQQIVKDVFETRFELDAKDTVDREIHARGNLRRRSR